MEGGATVGRDRLAVARSRGPFGAGRSSPRSRCRAGSCVVEAGPTRRCESVDGVRGSSAGARRLRGSRRGLSGRGRGRVSNRPATRSRVGLSGRVGGGARTVRPHARAGCIPGPGARLAGQPASGGVVSRETAGCRCRRPARRATHRRARHTQRPASNGSRTRLPRSRSRLFHTKQPGAVVDRPFDPPRTAPLGAPNGLPPTDRRPDPLYPSRGCST